jgi:hypothetical protein
MPPVAHDAGALFSPRHAPLSRKVIPMKRFCVEFAGWPAWKPIQNVALGHEGILSTGPVGRLGKVVFKIEVGPDANEKDPFPTLGDTEISGV